MNDIQHQNLKINYKTLNDGISCMTVFNQFGALINQLNNEEAEHIYNLLVGNPGSYLKRLKEDNKKLYIDVLKSYIKYDPIIEKQENVDFIIIKTEMGIIKYSKLKLAIFWLTHSNDIFYNTFGFSWVPDLKLQDIARNRINKELFLGVDFGKKESQQVEKIKIIPPKAFDLNKIELDDFIEFKSEMMQKGLRL